MITIQHDTLLWNICNECKKHLEGDPTMDILFHWTEEVSNISHLPKSLENNPLKQALLVQYVDKFLNQNMRIKFGNRFPFYLTDTDETEKKYFLEELKQQAALSNIFIHDIQDGARRETIALKLWVGATMGSKPTRATYNTPGGQREYTLEERQTGFREADNLANRDDIVRAGYKLLQSLN